MKTDAAAGLGMADGKTEVIIKTDDHRHEVDIKVGSVIEAVRIIEKAGGKVMAGPFDIRIGKCAVVRDPWDNEHVILDATRGTFMTDHDGNIIGRHLPDENEA